MPVLFHAVFQGQPLRWFGYKPFGASDEIKPSDFDDVAPLRGSRGCFVVKKNKEIITLGTRWIALNFGRNIYSLYSQLFQDNVSTTTRLYC